MADEREIAAYYDRGDEQGRAGRLGPPGGRCARASCSRASLPAPPATVLDVGRRRRARYALPLAAEGYEVHLLDPVALHVEQARAASAAPARAPLASARRGDARELPCRRRERRRRPPARAALPPDRGRATAPAALREARRVAAARRPARRRGDHRASPRPLDGVAQGFLLEPGFEAIVERDLADGAAPQPRPGIRVGSRPPTSTGPTSSSARSRRPGFDVDGACWRSRAPSAPRPRPTRSTPGSTTPPGARSSCARSAASRPSRACSAPSPHVLAVATRP